MGFPAPRAPIRLIKPKGRILELLIYSQSVRKLLSNSLDLQLASEVRQACGNELLTCGI